MVWCTREALQKQLRLAVRRQGECILGFTDGLQPVAVLSCCSAAAAVVIPHAEHSLRHGRASLCQMQTRQGLPGCAPANSDCLCRSLLGNIIMQFTRARN